eukprot:g7096.t1
MVASSSSGGAPRILFPLLWGFGVGVYGVGVYSTSAAYSTDFSTVDSTLWEFDTTCFDCSAKNPDECTQNTRAALAPASVAQGAGLTITTTQNSSTGACTPVAGGLSGRLTFKPALSFGTIRVKSRYFPGSASLVKTAKGFIGLEDSSSGAITITIHGAGAEASGAPKGADWTRTMQSSCYQHGAGHDKQFTELDAAVDLANNFNWFEVVWAPDSVTISVNDKVVRSVSGTDNVPQTPLFARLHSRSIGYSQMPAGAAFASYIQEFSYTPLNSTAYAS